MSLKKAYKVNDKIIASTLKNINKMPSKDFTKGAGKNEKMVSETLPLILTQTPRNVPQPSIKMVL